MRVWTSSTTSDSPGKSSKIRLSSSITDAGRRPASTRRYSGRGARAAASAAAWSRARSISASDGSKAATSATLTQTLPFSPWSTVPRTSTIWSVCSVASLATITFSNTSSSTCPSRSSSVANITVEPERVLIFLDAEIMPPTFTHSPSRRSGTSVHSVSLLTRSASRTRLSGCSVMKMPIDSFSIASSSGRSNSSIGIGG